MTCAGNLFFIRFQTAIFICSRKIRVNDLWMPIKSAERTEADFKTRSVKSTAGKNGTVGKWEREQASHSKQKRQRGMNRLAESGVGWGKSTHTPVVKERGGDWIRQLLNCTSSRGKTPSLETDQPNEQRTNKESPKQPPSLSEHFLFLLAASTWPQAPAGAAGPGRSIWSVQSSAANRENVEAIKCICVLMAPFSAAHSQWATAPSVHVHTVNEANSSSSQFHIQSLEISESRTHDRIAFQPTE